MKENAEYHQAKEDQGFNEGRIAELRVALENVEVTDGPAAADTIRPGTLVTLRDGDGDDDEYIFASALARKAGQLVVTPESPLGEAMAGKAVGHSVSYSAPAGTFTYEVIKIEPADI